MGDDRPAETVSGGPGSWPDFFSANDFLGGQRATPRPARPPKVDTLRQAIARAIERHSAYDVASLCESLGLEPPTEDESPMSGKFRYAMRRLRPRGPDEVVKIARAYLDERDNEELEAVLDAFSGHALGPDGQMRNLIFASSGPKPQIVLSDAIDNQIRGTGNVDTCLVYDRPLGAIGVLWSDLIDWWSTTQGFDDEVVARVALWDRLRDSMVDSEPERILFQTYIEAYRKASVPALFPQVYLHYDPYTRRSGQHSGLTRERMDFLLLLPGRRRVVIEIDGKHHYTTVDGRPDPAAYARTVAEDRRLRLSGYEVYRFGGQEFDAPMDRVHDLLARFFDNLLGG